MKQPEGSTQDHPATELPDLSKLPLAQQRTLLGALLKRYTELARSETAPDTERAYRLNSLRLATGLLEKTNLPGPELSPTTHYVVLGPTQAGKSSLINLLLGNTQAGVSALAGHTVRAQGFAITAADATSHTMNAVAAVMAPQHRVAPEALERDALDQYTLERADCPEKSLLDQGVLWDTPDFDSIESGSYRAAVMHSAALADVLILATSKDKYADRSVWDILDLIHPLGKPLLLVVNKLEASEQGTVLHSLRDRYHRRFGVSPPPIVALPFRPRVKNTLTPWPADAVESLCTQLRMARAALDPPQVRQAAQRFLRGHWARWLEPARAELAAATQWQQQVGIELAEAERLYRERYLNDPDKYDTFNRALAELLTLLEIPGVAATLARTRQWVTWPARTLFGLGKQAMRGDRPAPTVDQEQQVLEGLCDQVLTRLQGKVIDQPGENPHAAAWWQHLDAELRQSRQRMRRRFTAGATDYQYHFEPRINAAAQQLYHQLERQPRLLNTLRATRVTTDAAGVALAVKSGGLAPADLLLAPAMLAVTSLLTESALGRYLDGVKRELKTQQQREVAALFSNCLQGPLLALRERLVSGSQSDSPSGSGSDSGHHSNLPAADKQGLMLDAHLQSLLQAASNG